jgi:hypothetical protein
VVVPPSVTELPPKVAEIAEPAANPVPAMVSVLPTTPLLGDRVIFGMTVKFELAERVAAVSWTARAPAGAAGTVSVAPVKLPEALVVDVPPSATDVPAKLPLSVVLAGKFEPLTVRRSPTLPLAAPRVMTGVGIVNAAESLLLDASVATTVLAPAVWLGTVYVALKLPDTPLVPPVSVSAVPPNVAVTAELAANPVPVIVAPEPATPVVGESTTFGVTLYDAVAAWPATTTRTVCEPAVVAGTVNEMPEKAPAPSVVAAGGLSAIADPS